MSDLKVVKFNRKDSPEFFKELNKRVNRYFKEKKIDKHGNFNLYVKTAVMLSIYFVPFILNLTGVIAGSGMVLLSWFVMGLGMAGYGLAVMHDAAHGSYSKNPTVNNILSGILHLAGGSDLNWKIQHNVLHHSFTNIEGYDEDIDTNGLMRFSPNQEQKSFHKYQAFYAPFLYMLMTVFWVFAKDFQGLKRYEELGLLKSQKTTYKYEITKLLISRVIYLSVFVVLPLLITSQAWWVTILGFFIMHFTCGLILALIFQPAHVINDTEFFVPNEDASVENNWAIHQMKTTSNFANKSVLFSWYVGGLNYQVEHHLFPNISHVHYHKIAKIVKETANEYQVPYHHDKTWFAALRNHFSMINKLGKGMV